MSVATVVTEGFGSFGTVNFVITEGFGDTGAPPSPPPPPPPPPASSGGAGRVADNEGGRRRQKAPRWSDDGRRGVRHKPDDAPEAAPEAVPVIAPAAAEFAPIAPDLAADLAAIGQAAEALAGRLIVDRLAAQAELTRQIEAALAADDEDAIAMILIAGSA